MKQKYYIPFFLILSFFFTAKGQNYSPKQIDSLVNSISTLTDKKKALELGYKAYKLSNDINYNKGKMISLHRILLDYAYVGNDKKIN